METVLIWIFGGLLLCAVISLVLLWLRVLKPMARLRRLAAGLDSVEPEKLRQKAELIGGLPGTTACALLDACAAPKQTLEELRSAGNAAAEEQYKVAVADEICTSLLPQPPDNRHEAMTFSLAGGILPGRRKNCAFYDYFVLDEKTICLSVGQVPGSKIADALFTVVAQAVIRSQLRMGRPLAEAMSDINAQLYDLGGRNSANVLVCVLNTVSGRFSFVNAGGSLPLLMRNEEDYEWLDTPVYAPLGANESVSYRSEVMRLNQGDRLFLYTADLGKLTNRNGEEFKDREFQSVLNRSRSHSDGAEELLEFVQIEAAAFCGNRDDMMSSAAIALEYNRGNSAFTFTLVRASTEDAPFVTEFMRKTLEDGKVAPKAFAMQILLAEELFALCCRFCEANADIKVECAVKREEHVLHLRMFAPMDGNNPFTDYGRGSDGSAANYIRTHTKRVTFEAGIDRDMLEIVSELT